MATFFNNVQVGKWSPLNTAILGTLKGSVTRVGNTVRMPANLVLYSATPTSGSKQFTFTLNGFQHTYLISGDASNPYIGTYDLGILQIPVTSTQSSATITWSTSDGFSGTFNITFPAPPAKPFLYVSVDMYYDHLLVDYGTSSYGSPNTGVTTLYGGTDPNPTMVLDTCEATWGRRFYYGDLKPSTTYYFKVVADNGQMSTESDIVSKTTKKAPVFYVPVDGKARKTAKMYCSVNGKTKRVEKFYGSVNGIARRVL